MNLTPKEAEVIISVLTENIDEFYDTANDEGVDASAIISKLGQTTEEIAR